MDHIYPDKSGNLIILCYWSSLLLFVSVSFGCLFEKIIYVFYVRTENSNVRCLFFTKALAEVAVIKD